MFLERLNDANPPEDDRTWVYVPYDQLNHAIGPLAAVQPEDAAIVLLETTWKGRRRPYHRQKLAWVLSSQRHFALEQAARGVHVEYLFGERSYGAMLRQFLADRGLTARVARPAERELRVDLEPLVADGLLEVTEHDGWFTTDDDFNSLGDPPWRMDAFYRRVRQRSGVLMEGESPVGGRYSFDGENREPWDGEPPAPDPPTFEVDPIKAEVADLIEQEFGDNPGRLDISRIAATAVEAAAHWEWVLDACMEHFGPYEDAMSTRSPTLFHTLVSPLLNNSRLLPADVVADVEGLDIPINSKEGFIRQVIGWREFVRHVHERTDGFRELDGVDTAEVAGDGGWSRWSDAGWTGTACDGDPDGGATPDHLGACVDLPPAFWGRPSGLNCLDTVVEDVWETGYGHHITRLMILSNIATLLDVNPRQLADWFWVGYVDAYDWVVEPNVLAMGTFATGPVMTTKPYVSGSNYIRKMSDYCDDCAFDPQDDCPLKRAYWAFLARHEEALSENNRMGRALWSLGRRSEKKKQADRETVEEMWEVLARGERLEPD